METEKMIPASEWCTYHHIELSFIYSLKESGLIEVTHIGEKIFVPESQLLRLEQLTRFNQEMDINIEGIETVSYLLQRINELQQQIAALHNKLAFYENT